MKLRIVSRTITYNKNKILLVKNKSEDFWYPPGGGWNYKEENIIQAATREVNEETGLNIKILRLLYVQEFHPKPDIIFFEVFWLAKPLSKQTLDKNHCDVDPLGQVEIAKWFSKDELKNLNVFPKRLKNTFWNKIKKLGNEEDPFVGIS
jgi:8-oxo-dGTP diphosphatase